LKQYLVPVIENKRLWAGVQSLTVNAPELARSIHPGQFALARDPLTSDPYLRRTLWPYEITAGSITFALPSHDPLAQRTRAGDTIDVNAPFGRAIEFNANVRRILLIGEDERLALLVAIAHDAIKRKLEVVLAAKCNLASDFFPPHLLSTEVEYRTEDTFNSDLIAWADAIVASGSPEFYRMLANAIRDVRYLLEPGFAQVLVDLPMPCGVGICGACTIETGRGVRLACTDGPTFDLSELEDRRTR
jgi:dihydroorotate dehydrogenase electron transfer subunit